MKNTSWKKVTDILSHDGVTVIPTDTLYGVVGKALSKKAVERVYAVKHRDAGKPCIVLVASFDDLKLFGLSLLLKKDSDYCRFLEHVWPDKVSVVLPCKGKKFSYLHRGTEAVAFRMISPKNKNLFNLITVVGPLVAPSANPEGLDPARTVEEAYQYFTDTVDGYVSGGVLSTSASTLVSLLGSKPKILRQGSVDIYSSI